MIVHGITPEQVGGIEQALAVRVAGGWAFLHNDAMGINELRKSLDMPEIPAIMEEEQGEGKVTI